MTYYTAYITIYCLLYLIQKTLKNRLTLISFNMYLSNNILYAFIKIHVDSIIILLIDNSRYHVKYVGTEYNMILYNENETFRA